MKKETTFIKNTKKIDINSMKTIKACLSDFTTYDEDDKYILFLLEDIFNNESIGIECSAVYIGTDPEGIDNIYFDEENNKNIIVFSYFERNIILPIQIGIKIITDWCAENTMNPEIPALCEQLKQKYEVE